MTEKKSGTPRAKARRIRRPAEEKNAEKVQLSNRLELLVTVVNRNKAEYFADLLTGFEVNMQLFVPARGTADAKTLSYLGLTDADKGVILSVIRHSRVNDALNMLDEKFKTVRGGKGIAFTIPFTSVIGALIFGFLSNNRSMIKEGRQ